jgi:hypothetical protein
MRVFISYVNEDFEIVSRLVEALKLHGIDVWFDKARLKPGQIWTTEIRNAIQTGDHFIACFSDHYWKRTKTYMNKELSIAIEELQQRPHNTRWFIPVCLTPCTVPEIPIGYGQYLSDIHAARLFDTDFDVVVASLVEAIAPFHHTFELLPAYLTALKGGNKLWAVRGLLSFLLSPDTGLVTIVKITDELRAERDLVFEQCIELARKKMINECIIKMVGEYCDPKSIAACVPAILDACKFVLPEQDHNKLYRPAYSWDISEEKYNKVASTWKKEETLSWYEFSDIRNIQYWLSSLLSDGLDEAELQKTMDNLHRKSDDLVFDQCVELVRTGVANERILKVMGVCCNPGSIADAAPLLIDPCKAILKQRERNKLYRPEFSWKVTNKEYEEIVSTFQEQHFDLSNLAEFFKDLRRCSTCKKGWQVLISDSDVYEVFDGERFMVYEFLCTHCKEQERDEVDDFVTDLPEYWHPTKLK